MALKTYDLSKVIVTVAGIPLQGGADGDKIAVERTADTWTMTVGADGETTRSKQNNASGTITITLQYGADANSILRELFKLDDSTGFGTFPIAVRDTLGVSICSSRDAFISKPPGLTYGRDVGSVEWVIMCGHLTIEPGLQIPTAL
jgi:hypothetical protein